MHKFERLALWSIIILIVVFLFFRGGVSGFTRNDNLMSLSEFSGIPDELKRIYTQAVGPIVTALGAKVSKGFNSMKNEDRNELNIRIQDISKTIVNAIKSAPDIVINATYLDKLTKSTQPMVSPKEFIYSPTDPTSTPGRPMGNPFNEKQVYAKSFEDSKALDENDIKMKKRIWG